MLYALLIYEKPDDFARRESSVESEAYAGAWRAYHRAMLDAGIFVGGKPLDAPETATTVRLRDSSPVHVSTRSPRPLRPASVSRRPPSAIASRATARRADTWLAEDLNV